MEPLLMTIKDAAGIIGIPEKTLWRLVSDGAVHGVRMVPGGKWYVRREIVAQLAAEGVPAPSGSALEAAALEATIEPADLDDPRR